MNEISTYLPLIIPIIILNLILIIICGRDIVKSRKFSIGIKIIWFAVILFIQLFGPLAYLLIGRRYS